MTVAAPAPADLRRVNPVLRSMRALAVGWASFVTFASRAGLRPDTPTGGARCRPQTAARLPVGVDQMIGIL
jgi:hypothetical protein